MRQTGTSAYRRWLNKHLDLRPDSVQLARYAQSLKPGQTLTVTVLAEGLSWDLTSETIPPYNPAQADSPSGESLSGTEPSG